MGRNTLGDISRVIRSGSAVGEERFDSGLGHHLFISTLGRRQVVEKWWRYGGSIKSISVVGDSFREEQLLQSLLVVEGGLQPQVRRTTLSSALSDGAK